MLISNLSLEGYSKSELGGIEANRRSVSEQSQVILEQFGKSLPEKINTNESQFHGESSLNLSFKLFKLDLESESLSPSGW